MLYSLLLARTVAQSGARRSFWTLTGSPSLLDHPAVLWLAEVYNITAEQVVYKFAQSEGITPLSGTTNEEHMREDVAVEKLSFPDGKEAVDDLRNFIET